MIRIPDIAGQPATSIGAPVMRPGAAAAPAVALREFAQTLAGVSDHFQDSAMQAQKLENARKISETRRNIAQQYGDFQMKLEADPDPASRIQKTRDFLSSTRGQIDLEDHPPAVRDELVEHFENFASQAIITQATEAHRLGLRRTAAAIDSELETATNAGNREDFLKAMATGREAGIILPEEETKHVAAFDRTVKARAVSQLIQDDPFSAQEELAAKDFSTRHPELSPEDIEQLQRHAAVAVRQQSAADIDTIQDGIAAGAIKTPEDIEGLAAHIRPAAREELKSTLEKRQSELQQVWLRRPEVQARFVGEANSAISDYNPENPENYDTGLARIHGLIDQVATGAVRDELTRRIREVREGKQAARKGTLDRAVAALEDSFRAGGFGGGKADDGEHTLPVSRAIADGFLRDQAKLQSLGFTSAQLAGMESLVADELKAATKAPAWKGLGDTAKAARSAEVADKARADWFRQNWQTRDETNAKATDPAVLAVAEAIADGATAAKWTDPSAASRSAFDRQTAQKRKGEAIRKLIEWHADNPEAKEKELEAKLFEYAGEAGRKAFLSAKVAPPPRRSGASLKMILPAPLAVHAATFEEAGRIYGISPLLLAAISMNETANGTSSAFRNKNNALGISDENGPIYIDSVETSIKRMARLLGSKTGGPYKDARTLAEVADIYAPVGAKNDPRKLNGGWFAAVSRNLRALGGDPSAPIK